MQIATEILFSSDFFLTKKTPKKQRIYLTNLCVWCDKCRHKGLCNSFIIYFQINEPNLGSFSLISEFSTKEGWSKSNETQNAAMPIYTSWRMPHYI